MDLLFLIFDKSSFLFEPDLCAAQGSHETELTAIESLVERVYVRLYKYLRKVSTNTILPKDQQGGYLMEPVPTYDKKLMERKPASAISRDDRVFNFPRGTITTIARLLVTRLLIALLLIPIIIVHAIESLALQIVCIMIASGLFVFVLSDLMHARMAEIFVAGAT